MEETLISTTYAQLREAIRAIDRQTAADIYALSFWKSSVDNDPRKPIIQVGYNTLTHWKAAIPEASSSQEAKWSFAFWLQNELLTIGGEDPAWRDWVKQLPCYYTDAEQESDFEQTLDLGEQIEEQFISIITRLAQWLHAEEVIHQTFERSIPIIIHELEYYGQPVNWTRNGNPKGVTQEFEDWVNSLG